MGENNLQEIKNKYNKMKVSYEKPKMASIDIDKKAIVQLAGSFDSNLDKWYQEKTKSASINLLEKFDFDILLNKITLLEKCVEEFSAEKFDKLKDGFRGLNKTLDDIKNNTTEDNM